MLEFLTNMQTKSQQQMIQTNEYEYEPERCEPNAKQGKDPMETEHIGAEITKGDKPEHTFSEKLTHFTAIVHTLKYSLHKNPHRERIKKLTPEERGR